VLTSFILKGITFIYINIQRFYEHTPQDNQFLHIRIYPSFSDKPLLADLNKKWSQIIADVVQ